MDFSFTGEQTMLRDTLERLFGSTDHHLRRYEALSFGTAARSPFSAA